MVKSVYIKHLQVSVQLSFLLVPFGVMFSDTKRNRTVQIEWHSFSTETQY